MKMLIHKKGKDSSFSVKCPKCGTKNSFEILARNFDEYYCDEKRCVRGCSCFIFAAIDWNISLFGLEFCTVEISLKEKSHFEESHYFGQ